MRTSLLSLGLTALVATLATSVSVAYPDKTVYLYGPVDMARLRASNPAHAARAERIMASANQLCRPAAGVVVEAIAHATTRSDAQDISCTDLLLKTSNPPKREISFTLDNTRYIALMVITDDPPRVVPAR